MSSAFALFAPAPPASAGTPAAAPGGQDGQPADLFSSKLAEAFRSLDQADAAKAETPQRAPGRLSLQTISPTDLAAVEAEGAANLAANLAADLAAETEAEAKAEPTPDLVPLNRDAEPAEAADVAITPQPVALPVVVPVAMLAPSSEAAATDGVTGTAGLPPAPAAQVGQETPVADLASDLIPDSAVTTAKPTETTPPQPQPMAAEPAPAKVESPVATPTASSPSYRTTAETAAASQLISPEKPSTTPASNAAKTEVAEAARLTDTSSPKSEVKITVQPATAAVPTATPVQTAAVVSNLAVAKAVEAIEAQAEAPQQNASDTDLPVIEATQSSQTAPTKRAETTPAPSTPLRSASDNTVPSSGARPPLDGSDTLATDHVAMADAASSMSQTRQVSLGQVAPGTDGATPAAVPLIDAGVAPLDPATPVDTPAEVRALDGATSTTQTAASSLSRATIETTAHLAAQIARKLEGRSTRFDMVLTPEDLGRVDVSLEIGADGQLAARLAFDNPAAAAELRGRADELRRQLQDAGFQVASDSLDFTQRDTSSGGGFDRQQQQRQPLFGGAAHQTTQADLSVTPPPGAWTNHSQTRDRVDVRV